MKQGGQPGTAAGGGRDLTMQMVLEREREGGTGGYKIEESYRCASANTEQEDEGSSVFCGFTLLFSKFDCPPLIIILSP